MNQSAGGRISKESPTHGIKENQDILGKNIQIILFMVMSLVVNFLNLIPQDMSQDKQRDNHYAPPEKKLLVHGVGIRDWIKGNQSYYLLNMIRT